MAAGDIEAAGTELSSLPTTVEVDATERRIETDPGSQFSLVNAGDTDVHCFFKTSGVIPTDGLEAEGYVVLTPNDSFPLPKGTSFFRYRTAASTSKIWYAPLGG